MKNKKKKKTKYVFAWNDTIPDDLDGLSGRDAVIALAAVTILFLSVCVYGLSKMNTELNCYFAFMGPIGLLILSVGWLSCFKRIG